MWKVLKHEEDSDYGRYGHKRMGMREHVDMLDKIVEEIYKCGFEKGYEKAREESESYGERRYR